MAEAPELNAERAGGGRALGASDAREEWRFRAPAPAVPVEPGPTPTFSVVIAAYEAAETIGDAVASALDQTLPPLEVIVCDDASTDDIAGALAPLGGRVKLIRLDRNAGPAAARNEAVRVARGDFVATLDADDVFMPQRLEAVAALAAARPDLDILTTDALIEVDGRTIRRAYDGSWVFEVEHQRRGILRYNFIHHAAVRRSAWLEAGGQDPSLRWAEDWELWIRLILAGSRVGLVEQPLIVYRLNPRSLSAAEASMRRGELVTLERTAASGHDLDVREEATLTQAIDKHRRRTAVAELQEALLNGSADARRRAAAVARGPGYRLPTRLKAMAATLFPGLVAAQLRRRRRGVWTSGAGMKIERR